MNYLVGTENDLFWFSSITWTYAKTVAGLAGLSMVLYELV
jgi:hypothetical protein